MKQLPVLESISSAEELAVAAPEVEYSSNVMVLYQDLPARAWARATCERVRQVVGAEALRSTYWKINGLSSPAVLAGAVSTAMRADVIVVSIYAAEALPLAFYVWADSWLPHRRRGAGTLMALLALPERPSAQLERVRDYLRVVARQGGLDFLCEERKLVLEPARTAKPGNRKPGISLTAASDQIPSRIKRNMAFRCFTTTAGARERRAPVFYALSSCSSDR